MVKQTTAPLRQRVRARVTSGVHTIACVIGHPGSVPQALRAPRHVITMVFVMWEKVTVHALLIVGVVQRAALTFIMVIPVHLIPVIVACVQTAVPMTQTAAQRDAAAALALIPVHATITATVIQTK
jgi:hypothetical protein